MRETCLACGAPLPQIKPEPQSSSQTASQAHITPLAKRLQEKRTLESARDIGEDIEKYAIKGLRIYSIFWRTLAESLVIAISTFCIGLASGACGMSIIGIMASIILGATVGTLVKGFYRWLLITLLGIIMGLLLGGLLYVLTASIHLSVLAFIIICFLSVVIGSARLPASRRNLWEKIRPFAGAAGGLLFGMLGTLVGWGLIEAVNSILK